MMTGPRRRQLFITRLAGKTLTNPGAARCGGVTTEAGQTRTKEYQSRAMLLTFADDVGRTVEDGLEFGIVRGLLLLGRSKARSGEEAS